MIVLFFAGTYGSFICGWNCSLQEFCQGWWHSINWYFSINRSSLFSQGLCFHNSLFSDEIILLYSHWLFFSLYSSGHQHSRWEYAVIDTAWEFDHRRDLSRRKRDRPQDVRACASVCRDVPQDPHPLCFCLFLLILGLIRAPHNQKRKTEMINYGQTQHHDLLLLLMPIPLALQLPLLWALLIRNGLVCF